MGIEAKYRRVTTDELNRLQRDKKFAAHFLGIGTGSILTALRRFKELVTGEGSQTDPSTVLSKELAERGKLLDIDKDWQALHFLLTGEFCFAGESKTPPPLSNVIMGGSETKWNATYGEVRLLSAAEVKEVAEALSNLSRNDLQPRLDPNDFNRHRVYPAYDRWDAEGLRLLLDVYDRVKAFFAEAAKAGELVLISFD